ncbi:MAG: hypothetical protein ACJ75H_23695 [Thermoanaerobaculia bacterium]
MNIGDFVGKWDIHLTQGVDGNTFLQENWALFIGTDSALGDLPPKITDDYSVVVGFALVDPQDADKPVKISTDPAEGEAGNQPLWLRLTGEQLRWKGYYKGKPLYIYISAAETLEPTIDKSVHLYGSTVYGDPDQVAVWGAGATPPPPPDPGP